LDQSEEEIAGLKILISLSFSIKSNFLFDVFLDNQSVLANYIRIRRISSTLNPKHGCDV